jgi:hypothetical protein
LQLDLAPDFASRYEEVLALEADALVARMTFFGTARESGGPFENKVCALVRFGVDGRVTLTEWFEAEQTAEALARFDAVAGPIAPAVASPFENSASRAFREIIAVWVARDESRWQTIHSPSVRYRDHRRLFRLDLDRQEFLDFSRPLLTLRSGSAQLDLVATRGERLALMRLTVLMSGGEVGPSAIDSFMVIEADERGAIAAYDRWDPEDEDAAWADLDRRFDAGEGAAFAGFFGRFANGVAERDWDAFTALCSPEIVEHDHRPLTSIGITRRRDAYVQKNLGVWTEIADAILRFVHVRGDEHAALVQISWEGGQDDARFEVPQICVGELDAQGRLARVDVYELDQLDAALARFEELSRA